MVTQIYKIWGASLKIWPQNVKILRMISHNFATWSWISPDWTKPSQVRQESPANAKVSAH